MAFNIIHSQVARDIWSCVHRHTFTVHDLFNWPVRGMYGPVFHPPVGMERLIITVKIK